MSRIRLIPAVVFTGLVSLMTCAEVLAEEVVQIITPVPAPKEVTTVPQGFVGCFDIPAGWYKNVWYPQHRVCQYDSSKVQAAQGEAYVEGYWGCTKYATAEQLKSQCTNWTWKPAHWVKTLPVY